MDEFEQLDATGQADLVKRRLVRPRELAEAAIRRAEHRNPELNAIIAPRFDEAMDWAETVDHDAPLGGVPFLLKDLGAEQAGQSQTMGNRALKEIGYRSNADSELGGRFRRAGLVTLGRTNTPEIGMAPTTQPLAYGATRNPWDHDRSTSGSSGGSAAAVAAGIVPVAHGNDAGGSIRLPAAWCGLVGLKPSRGRTPPLDLIPADRFPVEFALTRTVRDAAALLDCIHGTRQGDLFLAPPPSRPFALEAGADPGHLRIAVCTEAPGVEVERCCADAARAVAATLEDLGHHVEPDARPTHLHEGIGLDAGITITGMFAEAGIAAIETALGRPINEDDVEPYLWWVRNAGIDTSLRTILDLQWRLHHYTRRAADWWNDARIDVLVLPTAPTTARPLAELEVDPANPLEAAMRMARITALTRPFNTTGEPAMSLPLATSDDGLPIGVQLVARHGQEAVLLRVAAQLEQAMPWRGRTPLMSSSAGA